MTNTRDAAEVITVLAVPSGVVKKEIRSNVIFEMISTRREIDMHD